MTINNSNYSQNNINNYIMKEKKYSLDDSIKHLEEKNIESKNKENKKLENNNETSFSLINYNRLNFPIIMVASSLMKDIRDIYKFKEKPLGGGNFGTVRKFGIIKRKKKMNRKKIKKMRTPKIRRAHLKI